MKEESVEKGRVGKALEESHENAIRPVDLSGVQTEALASRHAELKDRLRSIGQGFDWLRRVSHQGYGAETEFTEPRVLDLWDMAKSANFTEKELESFRVRVAPQPRGVAASPWWTR